MSKTVIENHKLYIDHPNLNGQKFIELLYYPSSHAYKVNGEKIIGVSGVLDVLSKEGLMFFYMNEAIAALTRTLIPNNDGIIRPPGSLDIWEEACKQAKTAYKARSDRGKNAGTGAHNWLEEFLIAKRDGLQPPALPTAVPIPPKPIGVCTYEQCLERDIALETNNLIEALSQFVEYFEKHTIEIVALERIVYSNRYKYAGRFDAILRIDGKLYLVDFKTNNPTYEYPDGIYPEMFCQLGGYDVAYTEEFSPDLDSKGESMFDGHAIFNFNKKTGKFSKQFREDLQIGRNWFVHALGTKRSQQHYVRKMSMKYKENRKER